MNTLDERLRPLEVLRRINSSGGYSFAVDDWARLDRFLVLGSEGGSYYASERDLTGENVDSVVRCIRDNPAEVVRRTVNVSCSGRAPKNDPALLVLALVCCHGDSMGRMLAYESLNRVARTGTHLFTFVDYCNRRRGWGSGLKHAIGSWYTSKEPRELAYQAVKYQQRKGWSHRDVLRLAHPRSVGLTSTILHWMVKGWPGVGELPHPEEALWPIWAMERARRADSEEEIVRLIRDYRLVRECIPTRWLNSADVWEALLEDMPLTALVRNLGKLSVVGLLEPFSLTENTVLEALGDDHALRNVRLHPLQLQLALKTYSSGHGVKGSNQWKVNQRIVDALEQSFYSSFDEVKPTGKNWMMGIDVSGSMSALIAGTPLSCCEASTSLAMVAARVEPRTFLGAFQNSFQDLPIGRTTSLKDALAYTRNINFGGTDCSLPMKEALRRRLEVDVFVVLTDSETNYRFEPHRSLEEYRQKMGRPAKLAVVAMTSNGFSIANPNDSGMLDVVGMDMTVPEVLNQFAGRIDEG